jgi:hypothetical protein
MADDIKQDVKHKLWWYAAAGLGALVGFIWYRGKRIQAAQAAQSQGSGASGLVPQNPGIMYSSPITSGLSDGVVSPTSQTIAAPNTATGSDPNSAFAAALAAIFGNNQAQTGAPSTATSPTTQTNPNGSSVLPSAPSDPLGNTVNGFFKQYLGRNADAGGLTFYENQVTSGQKTTTQVASDIANSPEAASNLIAQAYSQYTGRAADTAGLQWYMNQVNSHSLTPQQAVAQIAASPEAKAYSATGIALNTPSSTVH